MSRRAAPEPPKGARKWVRAGGALRQDPGAEARAASYERRMADGPETAAPAPASGAASGAPLPLAERARHEAALGTDLSDIRVARGPAPRRHGAQAMAEGRRITLAPEAPRSGPALSRLVAHEIAHAAGPAGPAAGQTGPQFAPAPGLAPQVPAPRLMRSDFGTSLTLYFAQGAFLLGAAQLAALEALRAELARSPGAAIRIDGFASAEGSAAFNAALSESRRAAVRALLMAGRPGAAEIGGRAHGELPEDPAAAPEARETARAEARRVEITLVSPLRLLPGGRADAPEAAPAPLGPDPLPRRPLPEALFPRLELRPETDSERLNRLLRDPPPALARPGITVCGLWREPTRRFFERELGRLGVEGTARDILVGLGVGAVDKLPFAAIEQGLTAGGVTGETNRAILSAVRAACQQEWVP